MRVATNERWGVLSLYLSMRCLVALALALELALSTAAAGGACAAAGDAGFCRGSGDGAKSIRKYPNIATPALCCAACAKNLGCAAWTHYYTRSGGTLECNLLNGAGKRSAGNCTSAAVVAPPLPPSPLPPQPQPPAGAKNVLYLIVDDLRTQLGAYGHPESVTPHMDALAASGTRFTHAYVQQAVCAPSRGSFMTGLRPDSLQVRHYEWCVYVCVCVCVCLYAIV